MSFLPQPYELHGILSQASVSDVLDRRLEAGDLEQALEAAMNPGLYLAQRGAAFILAFAVTVHLITLIYAVRGGLTAGDILPRTHGNRAFLAFYLSFVVAAAMLAPMGRRSGLRVWLHWRGRSLDVVLGLFSVSLVIL